MPHIFEPFFTSGDGARGAGLGLAIARELAERMHGQLTVRSTPGATTFKLTLPGMSRAPLIAALARRGDGRPGCGFLDSGDDDARRRAHDHARRGRRARRRRRRLQPARDLPGEAPGVVTVVSMFDDGTADGSGTGVGSGFVLDGDGEIATNAHVVTTGEVPDLRKANNVYVEFADGNQVEAEIKGYDPDVDVALVKVDPEGLTLRPLPLGDSDRVDVGEPVAAIGSPFNERQSLSIGVVSAIDRSIDSLTAFDIAGAIQTDAAINPGNSGGPLVDRGRER